VTLRGRDCPPVGRWLLEQTERADSTGRDPVDHIAGDLIIVDLVIDRADRVVADEALDLRIVREWGNGRDELALVNELARVHAATMDTGFADFIRSGWNSDALEMTALRQLVQMTCGCQNLAHCG